MGDFSHFVITTIKLESSAEGRTKMVRPRAYRQSFAFSEINPQVSWELKDNEKNRVDYHVLAEGTFFVKRKGKSLADGREYEITDEILQSASHPSEPEELDGVFDLIKGLFSGKKGFSFRSSYEIHERSILGFLYHLVLPEYVCLDKNSISKSDNVSVEHTLRKSRYTITWNYKPTTDMDFPSIAAKANMFYDEGKWERIRDKESKTMSIPPLLKNLYNEAKFWVPQASSLMSPQS